MLLPYVVGGLVGAAVAAVEQSNRLIARPTLKNHGWLWWPTRLLLDAGLGVIAVGILREADTDASENLLAWIGAGATGPAVARLRLFDLGRGDQARPIGIATAYEPVRGFIEEQIDARSAEHQATWINEELLPKLERNEADPSDLASYVIDYLKGRRMAALQRTEEIDYIVDVRDGTQPPAIKRETIVRHAAFELHAYRLLDRFASAGDTDEGNLKRLFRAAFRSRES